MQILHHSGEFSLRSSEEKHEEQDVAEEKRTIICYRLDE